MARAYNKVRDGAPLGASVQHLLNLRGVYGAILAKRSDSKNRDIAESG